MSHFADDETLALLESLRSKVKELEADVAHWRYQADEAGTTRVFLSKRLSAEQSKVKVLTDALERMNRAYVNLMENGRDRIILLGGECDAVDVMERADIHLRESREALATVKEGN